MKTLWRYFLAYQDPKQEQWLEAQARRGLHLVTPGLFRFVFSEGEPRADKYRLDFRMLRGSARDEYLTLFRDSGWDFIGQIANRYYFRARPDALSPEIFSDVESRRDRIARQLSVCGAITGLLFFETSMGVTQVLRRLNGEVTSMSMGGSILTASLAGTFALLGLWCLWQMQRAWQKEH
jgi:hypothetical protein